MFKKHSMALVLGAMFVAPVAFADETSTEGVIYQADQTGNTASINQIVTEGVPQAAAIIQTDLNVNGTTDNNNYAAVLQGIGSGDAGVTIADDGTTASNAATDGAAAIAGAAEVLPPLVSSLADYVDERSGVAPYAYTFLGVDSNNYGLVFQDHQQASQALVVQARSDETDAIIPNQASLISADIVANDGSPTVDGTVLATLQNPSSGNDTIVTYTAGELLVNYDGANDLLLGEAAYVEPDNVSGNLAFVTQGALLTFNTLNEGTDDFADLEDAFTGGDDALNKALVIQATVNSYAFIGQHGQRNNSIIVQNSDGDGNNVAESYQYTDADGDIVTDSYSLIAQSGNFNIAQVYQAGLEDTFNSSYLFQFGDGNIANVDQLGQQAVSFVYQSNNAAGGDFGLGNYASVYQHVSPL
ncbi:hypothetical protein D0B54_17465 [Solimonas sp. K1W22B-7]|uniref:hypothetical protein n=1 Tax=Solimonas sp. K1W22B-7 TaxID=2303331 RepID=UPI000E3319BB|nr:hypothetical protein [Solimonas sp. K1W22B-7]AXQ30350.1 hypothetical protein D0B54_17465 [Solimonas sp. K1W22B-7]